MTKKELKWRLKDAPLASTIAELVKEEVITKEEARSIFFNEEVIEEKTKQAQKIEALEKQIEFLQDLVTELSKNRTSTVFHTTEIVKRYEPYWREYRPYWMSTGSQQYTINSASASGTLGSLTTTNASNNMSLATYTNNLIG